MRIGTACCSPASWRSGTCCGIPTLDAPITIEECRELAAEEGLQDAWAIAERYAAAMLPAVFRIDDPVLGVDLDPAHTQKLTALVTGLDPDTFQAEDSLGWTYQFWRAAEKEAVNASGVKIGADELPAVTQLFTEPYMVRFLLHNTLGAWWAGKRLAADPELAQRQQTRTSCAPRARCPATASTCCGSCARATMLHGGRRPALFQVGRLRPRHHDARSLLRIGPLPH